MSKKFHINKAGEVKECHARLGKCSYGGTESHFYLEKDAQYAADLINSGKVSSAEEAKESIDNEQMIEYIKQGSSNTGILNDSKIRYLESFGFDCSDLEKFKGDDVVIIKNDKDNLNSFVEEEEYLVVTSILDEDTEEVFLPDYYDKAYSETYEEELNIDSRDYDDEYEYSTSLDDARKELIKEYISDVRHFNLTDKDKANMAEYILESSDSITNHKINQEYLVWKI